MRRTVENIRRFRLSDSFIEPYVNAEVPWGPSLSKEHMHVD